MRDSGVALHDHLPVAQLKNLGQAATIALSRIGILTYGDLAKSGAFEVWLQLRANGTNWNMIGLYALVGALMDCDWRKLPDDVKSQLQVQASIIKKQGNKP